MPPVKPLSRISDKWARVASVSGPEYEAGVRSPRTDWAAATKAAENNYEQGVQKAITRKAFGKGVSAAGTQKWQERTLAKGPGRWQEGINQSKDQYEKGFAPYRDVIERTALPPRGAKGDPKNIARVGVLAKALHDEKMKKGGN